MTRDSRASVEMLFTAFMTRDMQAVLALLAEDAVLIDPHYPTPRMEGKEAITEGIRWAFAGMRTFGFTIVNYYQSGDGRGVAVEVATAHVLKTGMALNFPQMFVFDLRDGQFTRIQAYEPYGPNGIGGAFLALTRLQRKISALRRR